MALAHGEPPDWTGSKVVWHHRVHDEWDRTRLVVWRLRFAPTYSRDHIVLAVEQLFDDLGVYSYAVYELLGEYDVLCRVWLPYSVLPSRVDEELEQCLLEHDFDDSDYFEVTNVARHWAWPDDNDQPTEESLANRELSPDQLWGLTARISEGTLRDEDREKLDSLYRAGFVRTVLGGTDKIRFFVVVKRPAGSLAARQRRLLSQRLSEACEFITDGHGASVSLYLGNTDSLIMGALPFASFHDGMNSLIEKLNSGALFDFARLRTHTSVTAQRDFLLFRERLGAPEEGAEGDVSDELSLDELLVAGEGEAVEFKSTAEADLRRYFCSDEAAPTVNRLLHGKWLASIVGMLNSRILGTLVIGIGEEAKLLYKLNADASRKAEGYLRQFAHYELIDPVSGLPQSYVIFGLAPDVTARDFATWDDFVLHLQQVIESSIIPSPLNYLSIRRVAFNDSAACLAISVTAEAPTHLWFYVESDSGSQQMFKRENARTIELKGPDQDSFKEAILKRARGSRVAWGD